METLYLHPNGEITKKGRPVPSDLLQMLSSPVELASEYTLGSFFRMADTYTDLKRISTILPPLCDIAAAHPGQTGAKAPEIDSLLFYKTIEINGFPGEPNIHIYNSLKGEQDQKQISLKFFHLETLMNHDLKLGRLRHLVFGETEERFQFDTPYTLFELVEGIAWELSFNFNPLQCSVRR